jgi:hypothetical protein
MTLAAGICCVTTARAVLPGGVFVQLESVPNSEIGSLIDYALTTGTGTTEDPYKVVSWYDQLVDNTDATTLMATAQDFGQDILARRPSLTQVQMPSGLSRWVADFHGGPPTATLAEAENYDYLANKVATAPRTTDNTIAVAALETVPAGGFNAGLTPNSSGIYPGNPGHGDPAFENNGVSWAVVVRTRSDIITSPPEYTSQHILVNGSAWHGQSHRSFFADVAPDDTIFNLRAGTREGSQGSTTNAPVDGPNVTADTWYITAMSSGDFDNLSASNNFTAKVLKAGDDVNTMTGTLTRTALTIGHPLAGNIGMRIGIPGLQSNTSNTVPWLNGQIAEVLIWNTALSEADLQSVVAELNNKYFVPAAGQQGDFNGDTKVDAADYVLWRKDPAAFLPADYNTWRSNFGAGNGAGSGVGADSVPEPGSVLLLVLGATIAGWPARRRKATQGGGLRDGTARIIDWDFSAQVSFHKA